MVSAYTTLPAKLSVDFSLSSADPSECVFDGVRQQQERCVEAEHLVS